MASSVSFSGMASGLDTDAIVEAMVSNYKLKADNSAKQQLLLEWKQDIYKDVSKKVYNFYTGIASKLRLESTFNKKLLTASNTTAIKLDSTSTVPSGTHTLTGLKMATSAQMQTYKMEKKFDKDTTMSDLGIKADQSITIKEGDDEKQAITIKFVSEVPKADEVTQEKEEGKNIIYLTPYSKISEFEEQINLSSATIKFDVNEQAFSVVRNNNSGQKTIEISGDNTVLENLGLPSNKKEGSSSKASFIFKPEDPDVKGKNISNMTSISSGTTMSALGIRDGQSIAIDDGAGNAKTTVKFVDKVLTDAIREEGKKEGILYIGVNEKISDFQSALKSAMPSASINFDSKAEVFFISSKTTGDDQRFEISGNIEVLKSLGFTNTELTDENKNTEITAKAKGSDAKYTYNDIKMTSASNNVSVNGLKFSITSNTNTTTSATEEKIIISSTPDIEGMASTIKSFVEEYNTLISELNDLINAPSAGSYEPLLDEEKEGMTDSQIEKWEKKIKDSLLRNDSTLKTLTSTMRNVLSGTFNTNSIYKSLSSIGVTTSSDWTANGKLELDEDKLKEALTNNPDEVIALFSANGDGTTSNKGLGDRIYDSLGDSFKRIANVKSATSLFSDTLLTKQRSTQSETTSKLEDRLETMKEMYYKRFTAMETALSKLNAQTDTLTSLLSS